MMLKSIVVSMSFLVSMLAWSQEYPRQPITLVSPFPPGGSADIHMRKFAELASRQLGQPVVVLNKPGTGTIVGSSYVASSPPDGYTVGQLSLGAFRLPHMEGLSLNPPKDFSFIIGLSGFTTGIVVKVGSPFHSLKELLDYAKKHPGTVTVGTSGTGGTPHLLMEELTEKTGARFLHVPFKGSSPNLLSLMGGHTQVAIDGTSWGPMVEKGDFRLLATFGEERTRWGAPTVRELGINIVSNSPYGIVGPRGMDPAVVRILHDAFKKASDDPENIKVLKDLDQPIWYKSSADYTAWATQTWASERTFLEKLGLVKVMSTPK